MTTACGAVKHSYKAKVCVLMSAGNAYTGHLRQTCAGFKLRDEMAGGPCCGGCRHNLNLLAAASVNRHCCARQDHAGSSKALLKSHCDMCCAPKHTVLTITCQNTTPSMSSIVRQASRKLLGLPSILTFSSRVRCCRIHSPPWLGL